MIRFPNMPRPSLNWMTPNQILVVRNNIAGLCYPKGERVELEGSFYLYPALIPRFQFILGLGHRLNICQVWLKIEGKMLPYWDYQFGDDPIEKMSFNNIHCSHLASYIKRWSKSFPLEPHASSLQNGGEFIA